MLFQKHNFGLKVGLKAGLKWFKADENLIILRDENLTAAFTLVGLKLGLKASLLPCKYTLNVT